MNLNSFEPCPDCPLPDAVNEAVKSKALGIASQRLVKDEYGLPRRFVKALTEQTEARRRAIEAQLVRIGSVACQGHTTPNNIAACPLLDDIVRDIQTTTPPPMQ